MNPFTYPPASLKKVAVALAAAATEAISLGLLDGTVEKVTLCVLAALGTFGVFAVRNTPAA